MRARAVPSLLTLIVSAVLVAAPAAAQADSSGFAPIFDGETLDGWHPSSVTWHSKTSGHTSAGYWRVEEGAIVGSQDAPGNGGILLTDEAFGDFEVVLEANVDFGLDSGIFLRSTEDGKAYQAMVDYKPNGSVMALYGENLKGARPTRNYSFTNRPDSIIVRDAGLPLPVLPDAWPWFWREGDWNELRARIVGNPPTITTWINGVKFVEWTEPDVQLPDSGAIGLQVHGGDYFDLHARYRNIRVKRLD